VELHYLLKAKHKNWESISQLTDTLDIIFIDITGKYNTE
jgi:hypothetical protein